MTEEEAAGTIELYQKVISHHASAPNGYHVPSKFCGRCQGKNPLCGDELEVYFQRDGNHLEVYYSGESCAVAIASASIMASLAEKDGLEKTMATASDFLDFMQQQSDINHRQLPDELLAFGALHQHPSRVPCATLPWATLQAALNGEVKASTES